MDDLLHRLRHDMVELSSQGDNFTHQIWLMYGQFEQVVDRFNPAIETHPAEERHSPRLGPSRRPNHQKNRRNRRQESKKMSHHLNPSSSAVGGIVRPERFIDSSDSESDSEPEVCPRMMARGLYGSRAGQRPGLNPLLETISVIGDLCDSDDAVDGPMAAGLYAGSNSVDSGYKSSCPTPDLMAQDASNYISGRPPVLKSRRTLPAIPVAVTGNHQPANGIESPPLDLDHLTSLRRTLLTAIERYDTRTKELDRDLMMTVQLERRPRSISPAKNLPVIIPVDHTEQPPVDRGQAEQQPDQDGATRFSRVARCMLEIIEDLQRQQQQQQNEEQQPEIPTVATTTTPVVPPKPSRMVAPATPAPATPPRVARRGRRKLPTPQPPPTTTDETLSSSDLTGADYHLYEEIIYDLGKSSTSLNEKCPPPARPPPLPARPSRPSQPSSTTSKPWLNVIKPLRRDRNNQLIRDSHWSSTKVHSDVISRPNLYTFGSQPTQTNHFIHTNKPRSAHEDEYGFRAVSHMV